MVKMNWNQKWQFTKDSVAVSEGSSVLASGSWEELDLPHTWNGDVGRILRTFKIKKNVEVTDNGKIII